MIKTDLFPVTTSDNVQINDIIQCLKSPSPVGQNLFRSIMIIRSSRTPFHFPTTTVQMPTSSRWRRCTGTECPSSRYTCERHRCSGSETTRQGDHREFAKFFNILRCFDDGSDRITNDGSSAMKASDFAVLFDITAVLFTSQRLTFRIQAVIELAHVAIQRTIVVSDCN